MQISIFDGAKPFKIDKPIRLIELFAGYGSQAFALEYLGVNFEHWKICEWAVKSIQAYKDAHFKSDNTDYSKDLTKEWLIDYLTNKGISANYNEPMSKDQIKRQPEEKLRTIYNNIKATHNLVNICQAHSKDFEIVDTDKYCYVMTYSFPCQDLSLAGKQKGMEKGSGTRSGMLWEVERILDECDNLPQVLLMENVPEVIGTNNIKHFAKWLEKLESLGYKCYWKVLNGKDYGVPQNRERCFMVSILGDYYYNFPTTKKLEKKLKDLLEDDVDEKFYLSDKMKEYITSDNEKYTGNNKQSIINREIGMTLTTRVGNTRADASDYICEELPQNCNIKSVKISGKEYPITRDNDNFIEWKRKGFLESDCRAWKDDKVSGTLTTNGKTKIMVKSANKNGYEIANEGDSVNLAYPNSKTRRGRVGNQVSQTLTTDNQIGVIIKTNDKRQRQLAEKIDITKDGQFLDFYNQSTNENVSGTITTRVDASNGTGVYNNYRIRKLTPKEFFRLMGVKDADYEKIAQNQSNASLYHLAGDSIIVDVLMAIFGEMI